MNDHKELAEGFNSFKAHYDQRLKDIEIVEMDVDGRIEYILQSEFLRVGNYPKILHHGSRTDDVVVLVHGLTDSPYYMEAIASRFYSEGANVILPLLPAHGLKDPDKAMEDTELDVKWKREVENAVNVAYQLGNRVSIGGLSTGGALSINFALRYPDKIKGGIYLFSAALDIGNMTEFLGGLIPGKISKFIDIDKKYKGEGPNPYKYPKFTLFGALELIDVIKENEKYFKKGTKLHHDIFAAHSIHDESARLEGINKLFKNYLQGNGSLFVISEDPPVKHASVVLEKDIQLDMRKSTNQKEEIEAPKANPKFDDMMAMAINFFRKYTTKTI